MSNAASGPLDSLMSELVSLARTGNRIAPELYTRHNVKRGLRNADGTGVLVGLTEVGDVHGYLLDENERVPVEGVLRYRGIDVAELVAGYQAEGRFGFEETCYLLLFGLLPTRQRLDEFSALLAGLRSLPPGFTESMILKAPSQSVMNKLARSVLASYSYDPNPDAVDLENVLRQSVELIARFPTMVAYGYQAKVHYHDGGSLVIHNPDPTLGTAENLLHMIRPAGHCTRLEAETLDLALILHAEHGGGNNSAFTTHVVTSTGTDTYSAVAAAVGSLKGPKHGGANIKVMGMMEELRRRVRDWHDEDEVERYLTQVVNREAFDRSGLIYGLGHAVYTLSDPRAVILKGKAAELAAAMGRTDDLTLYEVVERVSSRVMARKGRDRPLAANVDLYSGLVYSLLGIPVELYVALFAIARVAGWCAHRIEELVSGDRIIRPAYKSVAPKQEYTPLALRG